MICKPDPQELRAFASLRGDPNFKVILEYFERSLRQIDDDSRKHAEEFRVRWAQGGTQVLSEILALHEESKRLRG